VKSESTQSGDRGRSNGEEEATGNPHGRCESLELFAPHLHDILKKRRFPRIILCSLIRERAMEGRIEANDLYDSNGTDELGDEFDANVSLLLALIVINAHLSANEATKRESEDAQTQ